MKLRNFLFGAMASLAVLVGCTPNEDGQGEGGLFITVNNKSSVTFEAPAEGGSATYEVNAGEDWFSEINLPEGAQEWVSVNPPTGKAGKTTVTVTVLPNTGFNREQDVKFSIGMKSAFVSVAQAGDKGDEAATVIYYNNFDKETSAKEGNNWPKPGESDVWKNETGSGVANIDYSFSNVDVRSNGNDAQHYREPYASEASFVNNIFFGSKEPRYFIVKNIALGGAANLALSWGTEKYSQNNGSTFTNSEYQLYLSNDGGNKWVEIQYEYLGTEDDKWNLAKAEFSVPTGTETLSVAMVVTVASSYRMDDLKLVSTETATTTVDFTAAVEKDFSSTGGGSTEPSTPVEIAKSIESGNYWVMNAEKTKAVYPIESGSFGYWKLTAAQDGKSTAENAFTFTWVDGKGYTIKDSKGMFHFMNATYNSFQILASEQSDGSHYWAVSANQDGTYAIVNTVTGKTVQYSTQYGNYSPYPEVTGALPTLVAANDPVEGGDQGGSEGGEDGGDDPVVTPPAAGSTVVFDWKKLATTTNREYTGETVDGIVLTGTKIATNKDGQLRIYAVSGTTPGGTLTLNSGDKKMTKIAFTFVTNKEGALEATGYADGVWTGEANSVTFTNTGAQAQVTKIEITLAE